MNPTNVNLEGDLDSDIEELGSIRIVRRSEGISSEGVGISSQGNFSEQVTLATL